MVPHYQYVELAIPEKREHPEARETCVRVTTPIGLAIPRRDEPVSHVINFGDEIGRAGAGFSDGCGNSWPPGQDFQAGGSIQACSARRLADCDRLSDRLAASGPTWRWLGDNRLGGGSPGGDSVDARFARCRLSFRPTVGGARQEFSKGTRAPAWRSVLASDSRGADFPGW